MIELVAIAAVLVAAIRTAWRSPGPEPMGSVSQGWRDRAVPPLQLYQVEPVGRVNFRVRGPEGVIAEWEDERVAHRLADRLNEATTRVKA